MTFHTIDRSHLACLWFALSVIVGSTSSIAAEEVLTPIEASKQVGQTVTVELDVRGAGLNPPVDSEELYSEAVWTHADAFIVRFIGPVRAELKERNVLNLAEQFMHRKLRVTGNVKQLDLDGTLRSAIDVANLDDIEFADGPAWPETPPPKLDLKTIKKKKIDLRPTFNRYRLEARQQGQRGACQVFALTGVSEFYLARQGRKADLSEMFLMWSANDAAQTSRVDGFNQDLLIAGWQRHGVCIEKQQPYIARNEPIAEPTAIAKRDGTTRTAIKVLLIKHWASGIGARDDHLQRIFETLQAQNPLTVTLAWPIGFPDDQYLDGDLMMVERDESTWERSGHGVMLVGYEIHPRFPGGAVLLFRNSWGTKWGDQGYGKIDLTLARKLLITAYAVEPLKPVKSSAKKAAG